MCLVDYRGFRLIAISILPISDSTIIYGTCDAGRHIYSNDERFNKLMKKAATKLNILPHRVKSQMLYSPADLEGHLGKDDKYYLLDFSRVFPPEAPISSIKNAHLSRLLRPEFVVSYSEPLCSDSFSGFVKGNHQKVNNSIVEATEYLIRTLIPKFVKSELEVLMIEAEENSRLDSFRLTETIHSKGINCRYLGLIRRHLENEKFKTIILIDIVSRVIKNNLRLKLRLKMKRLRKPLEEPYRRLVIKYINLVFGNSVTSEKYWTEHLKQDIKRNFIMALTNEELETTYSLKSKVNGEVDINFMKILLGRLEKMTGMRFSTRTRNPQIFLLEQPFNETDLETLPLRVKHMNIVNFAEGFFYSLKGMTTRVEDPESAQKFYQVAIEKFEEALDSNPNNKEILLNVALTWTLLLEDEFSLQLAAGENIPNSHPSVSKATEYYLRAISCPPKYDSHSLFLYAYFLERLGNLAAEDYYLQSLEADPNNVACLLQYGNMLSSMGMHSIAEDFYKRASENTKGLKTMEWNYWGNNINSQSSPQVRKKKFSSNKENQKK